jgi:predicted DNA-binding transcriptional regulator YafY
MRGPARRAELLSAVYEAEGPEAYGLTTGRALIRRFEADKRRLRGNLFLPICYNAAAGGYVLEPARPLLDLPNDDLLTLAWLADTFGPEGPRADEVQRLLDRLAGWLPDERRQVVSRAAGKLPAPDLRLRDSEPIALDVWTAVTEAHNGRRELIFDYRTSDDDQVRVRQHHVQPWDFDFTDRGHWRLRGFCLWRDGPEGPEEPRDYRHYRLGRIVAGSARVLPRVLPPIRPRGKPRQVVFEMSPRIARFGVSVRKELIDAPTVTPAADGWVRVEGRTLDVFDLARNLLYYGAHCRVLGGAELLEEMRGLARGLAELYL